MCRVKTLLAKQVQLLIDKHVAHSLRFWDVVCKILGLNCVIAKKKLKAVPTAAMSKTRH